MGDRAGSAHPQGLDLGGRASSSPARLGCPLDPVPIPDVRRPDGRGLDLVVSSRAQRSVRVLQQPRLEPVHCGTTPAVSREPRRHSELVGTEAVEEVFTRPPRVRVLRGAGASSTHSRLCFARFVLHGHSGSGCPSATGSTGSRRGSRPWSWSSLGHLALTGRWDQKDEIGQRP